MISFTAFVIQRNIIQRHGHVASRRALTGAEVARSILNANGLDQVAIDMTETSHAEPAGVKQIYLERSLFEGKSLYALSQSAWKAAIKIVSGSTGGSSAFDFSGGLKFAANTAALLGWILIFSGLLIPGARNLSVAGGIVFAVLELFVLFNFILASDAARRLIFLMKNSNYFDVDGIARIQDLVRAIRLKPLTQILRAPFEVFGKKSHGL